MAEILNENSIKNSLYHDESELLIRADSCKKIANSKIEIVKTCSNTSVTKNYTMAIDSGRESSASVENNAEMQLHLKASNFSEEKFVREITNNLNDSPSQTKWYLNCDLSEIEDGHDDDNKENSADSGNGLGLVAETIETFADDKEAVVKRVENGSIRTTSRHSWHLEKSNENLIYPTSQGLAGINDGLTTSNGGNGSIKRDPFSSNLQNQMRAVSSPSLSDHPIDTIPPASGDYQQNENMPATVHSNQYRTSGSVLQKFKRTFTNFRNYSPTANGGLGSGRQQSSTSTMSSNSQQTTSSGQNETDTTSKYRFGPLIWRSSKERRKTKYNRRDKCNSGDSGIQIELENDEQFVSGIHDIGPESLDILAKRTNTTAANIRVRRTNSAKVTSSTAAAASAMSAKAKALRKIESCYDNKLSLGGTGPIPTRSYSQPTGLDRLTRTDLDESDTDSVSSHPDFHIEGHHRRIYAEVLFAFTPAGPQELALEPGCLLEILRKETGPWWFGRIKYDAILEKHMEPKQGWFPKDFVRLIEPFAKSEKSKQASQLPLEPEDEQIIIECDNDGTSTINNITTIVVDHPAPAESSEIRPTSPSPKKQSQANSLISHTSSTGSQESLRNSVVKELLETEINYVKLLSSLCLGYIPEMRKRIDIFSTESLNLIFSNIESIWRFQQTFLDALRHGIETDRIAQVFLENQSGFMVYSAYCNSYPRALMELESYSRSKEAKMVLENCRLAEELPELPLSAHLLAPIQRICRYPLQLAELIKHTTTVTCSTCCTSTQIEADEIDSSRFSVCDSKEVLQMALNAMKKVTETVNEGKRHSEHLARFQASFENFQGPPLHFHSTRFFIQTDATRVSPNLWNNTFTLFLFDHQLIYCKKDILKRNHFMYKGRIFLDNCRILNLPDGKIFGATVKNALRIFCESRNKWFDFSFRSASRKLRFLSTLAVERQFCGKNLFISEFAGYEDENLSDREYHSDYDTPSENNHYGSLNLNYDSDKVPESPAKLQKYSSDTLPKKSRHFGSSKEQQRYEYNTGSLGRRKIGSWFRKSKSTNSTPNQSPTHNPSVIVFNSVSDSSSQSSPALGNKPGKCKLKESNGSSS